MNNEKEKISDGLWIYRRPNTAAWWARIKEQDGWHRQSTQETDKSKARTAAIRLMGKVEGLAEAGKSVKGRKFSEASALYLQALDDLKKKGAAKPSHANYRLYVNKWIDPFFSKTRTDKATGKTIPERRINAINDDVINDWEIWRMEVREKELASKLKKKHPLDWEDHFEAAKDDLEPLSASSVKGIHIALRAIFDIAKRKGWVKLDQIPELNNIGVRAKARPWFRPEELIALKKFMAGHWLEAPDVLHENGQRKVHKEKTKWMRKLLRWYVLVLIDSGMRPGDEIEQVKWSNVNLTYLGKDGIIYPEVMVTAGKHAAIGKSRKTYCMNSSLQYFKDIAKFSGHSDPDDYVFTLPDGTRPHRFSDLFADLLDAAGLKRDGEGNERTLYSLRHTFITERLIADLPAQKIATHCGTSVRIIMDFYSKLEAGMSADEMLKLRPQAIDGKITAGSNLLEWM